MTDEDHAKNIDALTTALAFWESREGLGTLGLLTNEHVLDLKHRTGDVVLDTVTGKEVTVVGGTHEVIAIHRADGA